MNDTMQYLNKIGSTKIIVDHVAKYIGTVAQHSYDIDPYIEAHLDEFIDMFGIDNVLSDDGKEFSKTLVESLSENISDSIPKEIFSNYRDDIVDSLVDVYMRSSIDEIYKDESELFDAIETIIDSNIDTIIKKSSKEIAKWMKSVISKHTKKFVKEYKLANKPEMTTFSGSEINRLLDRFDSIYDEWYGNDGHGTPAYEEEYEYVDMYEHLFDTDENFVNMLRQLATARMDAFSSDREVAAITKALKESKYI